MAIALVVFDMAGTTVHDGDAVASCFRAALRQADLSASAEAINAVMGLPKPIAIRRLAGPALADAKVAAIHDDFVARMADFYATDPTVREVPGATTLFARLRAAKIKIGLDTGFSRSIVEVLLPRLGWRVPEVVDATVTSDEVRNGRPQPDMILHLMRRLGVSDAREVVKIGDTPSDLQQGRAAGCGMVIGVTYGTHSREQLSHEPHTHLIDGLEELPRVLGLA